MAALGSSQVPGSASQVGWRPRRRWVQLCGSANGVAQAKGEGQNLCLGSVILLRDTLTREKDVVTHFYAISVFVRYW